MLHGLLSFHKRSCTSGIGPVLEIAVRRPERPSRGRFLSLAVHQVTDHQRHSASERLFGTYSTSPQVPFATGPWVQESHFAKTHRGGDAKHEIHHAVSRYARK